MGIGNGTIRRMLRFASLWGGVLIPMSGMVAAQGTGATALTREWAERAFSVEDRARDVDHLAVLHDDEPGTAKLNRCAAGGPIRSTTPPIRSSTAALARLSRMAWRVGSEGANTPEV